MTKEKVIDFIRISLKDQNLILNAIQEEISAVKVYDTLMNEVEKGPLQLRFLQCKINHNSAVFYWKKEIQTFLNSYPQESYIWKRLLEELYGEIEINPGKDVLNKLIFAENQLLSLYQGLKKRLTPGHIWGEEIESVFVPRQKRHISIFQERMMN